jgi:hypothetical protein
MNALARWNLSLIFFTVLAGSSLRAIGLLDFSNPTTPDVLTVTDVTEEGRSWPLPEPGKPVFYEAISFGSGSFPGLGGDVRPKSRAMVDLIVKTLAEQGFQRAKEKGVAKVFLSISWGYNRANLGVLGFLGGDKLGLMWELNNSPFEARGAPRWTRSATAEAVMQLAESDIYFASIQAFDLEKLDAGEMVLLWHTRIVCEARGLYMSAAMPIMIVAGGPYIGRETKKPIWRDAYDLKKGRIDFGPLKTIEMIEPPTENGTTGGTSKK